MTYYCNKCNIPYGANLHQLCYLKFNNPSTGSLGHIHSILMSNSYSDTSGILWGKFHNPSSLPGNIIDVFLLKVNPELTEFEPFLPSYISFKGNA